MPDLIVNLSRLREVCDTSEVACSLHDGLMFILEVGAVAWSLLVLLAVVLELRADRRTGDRAVPVSMALSPKSTHANLTARANG